MTNLLTESIDMKSLITLWLLMMRIVTILQIVPHCIFVDILYYFTYLEFLDNGQNPSRGLLISLLPESLCC